MSQYGGISIYTQVPRSVFLFESAQRTAQGDVLQISKLITPEILETLQRCISSTPHARNPEVMKKLEVLGNELRKRESRGMSTVRYDQETDEVSLTDDLKNRNNISDNVLVEVVPSKYEKVIAEIEEQLAKTEERGEAPEKEAAPSKPTSKRKAPEELAKTIELQKMGAQTKAPRQAKAAPRRAHVIVQSREQAAQDKAMAQEGFAKLTSAINEVGLRTIDQKKEKEETFMFRSQHQTDTRPQSKSSATPREATSGASSLQSKITETTSQKQRPGDEPKDIKQKRSKRLAKELDQQSDLIRKKAKQSTQQKKEIQKKEVT